MYDELVKRLREADEVSMCGECGLNLHTGATKKGVLFAEAADAIEELTTNSDAATDIMKHQTEYIEELSKDLERSKEWEAFWEEEANEALKKFQTAVANMPRWIPVTERLPVTVDEIVVAFKNSEDGEWWYRIDNFVSGAFCYNSAFNRHIEYWMPLPEPPKEE